MYEMSKGEEGILAAARQQEIIRACEELYETMEYEDISIKEIAKSTSICRSNIYNYYQTKDEMISGYPGERLSFLDKRHQGGYGPGGTAGTGSLLQEYCGGRRLFIPGC